MWSSWKRVKTHREQEAGSLSQYLSLEDFPWYWSLVFSGFASSCAVYQNTQPDRLNLAFLRQRILNSRIQTCLLIGTNIPLDKGLIGWCGKNKKNHLSRQQMYGFDFLLYLLFFRGLNKQGYKCRRKLIFTFFLSYFALDSVDLTVVWYNVLSP